MQSEFVDRLLTCVDCHGQFVFTAGEQIFFLDKQFKNDPKRCKPCKCKRPRSAHAPARRPSRPGSHAPRPAPSAPSVISRPPCPSSPPRVGPVLCRQCFQTKRAQISVPATAAEMIAATVGLDLQTPSVEAVNAALQQPQA